MPETDHTKSRVYALYSKDRITPSGVIEIEKEKGLIHFGVDEPLIARLIDACKFAWQLVTHSGFTIKTHTMEEKNEQEIADWYAGKGLK